MKTRLKLIGLVLALPLLSSGLVLSTQAKLAVPAAPLSSAVGKMPIEHLDQAAGNQAQPRPPSSGLSAPKLIEAALASGKIDGDTANLYLAYALGDYEKTAG